MLEEGIIKMTHPVEYMTALITVSATFMAISTLFIGFIASRREKPEWYRKIMSFSLLSTVLGICAVVNALGWFIDTSVSHQNWAVGLLLFQFLFMYVPLVVLGIRFGWNPKKKPHHDK
jgi:amino acid transporter